MQKFYALARCCTAMIGKNYSSFRLIGLLFIVGCDFTGSTGIKCVEIVQISLLGKYKNKYTSLCIIMQEDFSIFLKEFTLFIDSLVLLKYPARQYAMHLLNVGRCPRQRCGGILKCPAAPIAERDRWLFERIYIIYRFSCSPKISRISLSGI